MPTDRHRIDVSPGLEGTNTVRPDPARRVLLETLAEAFDHRSTSGVGWDIMRESKRLAWPARQPLCVDDTLGDLRSDER